MKYLLIPITAITAITAMSLLYSILSDDFPQCNGSVVILDLDDFYCMEKP
jgi:hypothetical protein